MSAVRRGAKLSLAFFVFLALYLVLPDGGARFASLLFLFLYFVPGLIGATMIAYGSIIVLTVRLAEADRDARP